MSGGSSNAIASTAIRPHALSGSTTSVRLEESEEWKTQRTYLFSPHLSPFYFENLFAVIHSILLFPRAEKLMQVIEIIFIFSFLHAWTGYADLNFFSFFLLKSASSGLF